LVVVTTETLLGVAIPVMAPEDEPPLAPPADVDAGVLEPEHPENNAVNAATQITFRATNPSLFKLISNPLKWKDVLRGAATECVLFVAPTTGFGARPGHRHSRRELQ
jgi:hypothetical protein